MYQVKEKDWKQFRKMLPEWQEAYMERLTVYRRDCERHKPFTYVSAYY